MSQFTYTLVTCFDNDIHLTHKGIKFANPISSGDHLIFDENKFIVGEVIHRHDNKDGSVLFITPSEGNWEMPPSEAPLKNQP